jgi:deoxyadenosine/deoxycytidine kinase
LIVLLRPVGVGKSTMIRGLTQELRARGFRTYTTFIKSFHGPAYVLWALTARLLSLNGRYSPWFMISRCGRVNLARRLTVLSIYLDAYFSIPLKLVLTRLLRYFGYFVISEEYLNSTIFDHIYLVIDVGIRDKNVLIPLRVFGSLLNKYTPDITIVLKAGLPELRRRWSIRGYGEPELRYVLLQNAFLNKLDYVLHVDTLGMGVKDTLHRILDEVLKHGP